MGRKWIAMMALAAILPTKLMAKEVTPPAAATAPLTPSGKWVVEYADSMCVLQRNYGTGDQQVLVGFRPWTMSDDAELIVLSKAARRGPSLTNGKIVLQPSNAVIAGSQFSVTLPATGERLTTLRVTRDDLTTIAQAAELTITVPGEQPASVAPRGTAAALKALDACEISLQESWGITAAERELVATKAEASDKVSNWFSIDDYPSDALRDDASGSSTIIWAIGLNGHASECRVVGSSGNKSLDQAACGAIIKRARYKPAIGQDGKPMVTHSSRRINWILPQ